MKIFFSTLTFFVICFSMNAQVRLTNTNNTAVGNMSAFIDGSSNSTNNSSTSIGKGLIFPRVTLSTFTFGAAATGVPNALPSRYDGMIVYNTSTSGVAGAGATEGTLSEGYWFYENKSNSVTGGTWKRLNGPTASIKSKTVTAIADGSSATLNLGVAVITANEVGTFLGAKVYNAAGDLVMTADSDYNKATNVLTTGNGFIAQALAAGTYTVVVDYK